MRQARRPDGTKIRRLRQDLGLNVTQFAERVGIARQYLSWIELGVKKHPSLTVLDAIARELAVPLDDLLTAENAA
jgi:transcriptional regulator with XRE-family HTH domain